MLLKIKLSVLFLVGLSIVSCKKEEEEVPVNSALYDVTVTGMWSSASHPVNYPSNAHFSPLVGMVHNNKAKLFELGELASPGIKSMAETGSVTVLNTEIDALISGGNVASRINGTGISNGTGGGTATVQISGSHSMVSIVSMIAPSPDWFISIHDLSLIRNGEYISDTIINMGSYDSGTDSGTSFTSNNEATTPADTISLITDSPLGNGITVTPAVASIRFVLRK